jgi:Ca2+-transporting ATPase
VVASDKTGTLTEGRMAVQRVITPDGAEYAVSGTGYEPSGEILVADRTLRGPPPAALAELARAGVLCNDATLAEPTADQPHWAAIGDPLEAALVAFAARCGLNPAVERAEWPRFAEHPFEQATRRMTTIHRGPQGRFLMVCKGAPETVFVAPTADATPEALDAAIAAAHALAASGLRVLAIAADMRDEPGSPESPRGLRPLGLIAIGDPVRETAPRIAEVFAAAGIRLVLITGDHPATAAAVGGQLGIVADGDDVVRGDALANDDTDSDRADQARVFARIQPEQKLDIIAALQRRGHIVAMTGDGVNDAPALRVADIGVAMGGGTEVARQAADLVLVDDNLATVATAVREGRRIYDNIRRFLRYGLSGGAAEIIVMLVGPALGLAVPLLPAQILWVNLLTHGVPGVALGAEPAEPGTMRRPPRSPQESVLGGGLVRAVLVTGALIAAVTLGAGVAAYHLDRPWQSVMFVVLGLAQLGVALSVRVRRRPGTPGNPGLLYAVALSAALQVAGVLLPQLRTLLGTDPLGTAELLACTAVATLPALGARLFVR